MKPRVVFFWLNLTWTVFLLKLTFDGTPWKHLKVDTSVNMHSAAAVVARHPLSESKRLVRLDIVCCGYGDRVKYAHKAMGRDRIIAIDMGPCGGESNVWSYIFDKMPQVSLNDGCDVDTSGIGRLRGEYVVSMGSSRREKTSMFGKCSTIDEVPKTKLDIFIPNDESELQSLSCPFVAELVTSMQRGVSQFIEDDIAGFKRTHRWSNNKPIFAWHLRYGNINASTAGADANFANKNRAKDMHDNLDVYLKGYLNVIANMAQDRGWGDNYKVFVATDTRMVAERVKQLGDGKVFTRDDAFYSASGHPLTWGHLNSHRGDKCDLTWFVDPVKDLLLLGSADVLLSSNPSGFVLYPAVATLLQRKEFCRASTLFKVQCWDSMRKEFR